MKYIWWTVISGVVVTGIVVVWRMQSEETAEWKEVQQLQEEIRASMRADAEQNSVVDSPKSSTETVSEKERREELQMEKMAEYRDKLEALPEKLQKAAKAQMRNMFVSRMEQRIDRVLELPPEERDEELDKQIDEWDRRMAAWNKRRQQENTKQSGGGGGDNAGNDGSNQRKGAADKKKTGRRRGWMNASKEERDTWRRELLSRTTPEQRAKWHEYRMLIDERRKERGL